ncbi:MAG: glycosyltransferase family 2 protein [Gammaproteobacteria bacterium]
MVTDSPRVSVGMPVYNGAPYIKEAIDSILSQSFDDLELIISDNASTDATEGICRACAALDPRVRYVRNARNLGASDNYNAVCRLSTGQYFKWASSNDLCAESFILDCAEILDRHSEVVLCYPRTKLFATGVAQAIEYEDELDLKSENPVARFFCVYSRMRLNNIMNGLIRAAVLTKTPLIKSFFSSDVCLMAELALYGKFYEVPKYLFFRRMDVNTATKLKNEVEVLRHYDPDLKDPMLFQNWKLLAGYFAAGWRAPLSLSQRMQMLGLQARMLAWSRRSLLDDLRVATKELPTRQPKETTRRI